MSTKYYLTHRKEYLVTWKNILRYMDEQFYWMKKSDEKLNG
jgi:hypothetical protein